MFMIRRFYIGISRLRISSWLPRGISRLEISVSREYYSTHTIALIQLLEHRIIYLLRSVKRSLIIKSLMFGVWDVYFMKLPHWIMHLMHRIWRGLYKKSWKELILHYRRSIARISRSWFRRCLRRILIKDRRLRRYWKCPLWRRRLISCSRVRLRFMS